MKTAIPTTYKGVQMRSRLEARWAQMFDLLHWPWEYEPVDLDGYIPDFALLFYKPVMVEIKPALTLADLSKSKTKIDASRCPHEVLLLGATIRFQDSEENHEPPFSSRAGYPYIGLLRETNYGDHWWDEAGLFGCDFCHHDSLKHRHGSYQCRRTGCYEGDHHLGPLSIDVDVMWSAAGNAVQYRAKPKDPFEMWRDQQMGRA